jgi:hypothetical protein
MPIKILRQQYICRRQIPLFRRRTSSGKGFRGKCQGMKKCKVCGFVKWELDFYRAECNFTSDEGYFFDLRNDEYSIEEIAEKMGYSVSKVNDLSDTVKAKIEKVFPVKEAFLKKYCDEYDIN